MANLMTTDNPLWLAMYMQQQRIARKKRSESGGDVVLPDEVFPAKDFYSNDFDSEVSGTLLRNLDGWSAYSSTNSTNVARDMWRVYNSELQRLETEWDFDAAPGKFIIGRDTGSPDHMIRVKLSSIPNNGDSIMIALGATTNTNSLVFKSVNSNGVMQNLELYKNVGGTLTPLDKQNGTALPPARTGTLLPGDIIELHVIGRALHLFVNGYRIFSDAGGNIDTGGVFVKGNLCGIGSGQGLGAKYDDVYMAPLAASLTIAATPIFWPADIRTLSRSIPVSGTYTGTVSALDYRAINSVNGSELKGWTRMPSPSITGGAWSGNATIPVCSMSVHPKIKIQIRTANDTDALCTSGVTTVGLCPGMYGQSNSVYRGQGFATSHAVSGAYTFAADDGSEWQGGESTTFSRSQLFATQIASATGIPCGVFVAGSGSKSAFQLATRGDGDNVLDEMEALCRAANAYGYVFSWLWTQGESESCASLMFNETTYRSNFDLMMSELRAGCSGGYPAKFGVCVIGPYTGPHINGTVFGNESWTLAREGLFKLADKEGVYISSSLNDIPMADEFHYQQDGYVESGRRCGLSMAKAEGYGGYDGRGPIITSATRSGAVITLAVDLNGATGIAGTGLTNYRVSSDDFVTDKAITSVNVVGSTIVVTLAADPLGSVEVRNFTGMAYGVPVRAIGTYADATTIAVEPLYVPMVAA